MLRKGKLWELLMKGINRNHMDPVIPAIELLELRIMSRDDRSMGAGIMTGPRERWKKKL